jgi:hypothetical protein
MAGARLDADEAPAGVAETEESAETPETTAIAEAPAAALTAATDEEPAVAETEPESPAEAAEAAPSSEPAEAAGIEEEREADEAAPMGLVAQATEDAAEATVEESVAPDSGSEAEPAMAVVAAPVRQHPPVREIKSMTTEAAAKLRELEIETVSDLHARAGTSSERSSLAKQLGVELSQLTEWVNRADLMRLDGVGVEYANLLEESGVDSCKELRHRVPANLLEKMKSVNEERSVVRRLPKLEEVESWVTEAKLITAK